MSSGPTAAPGAKLLPGGVI